MSITGQVGHIAVAKQAVFGNANVTAGDYRSVKITGDSLVASNNPLIAEGEIGQGRDVTQAVPGGFTAAGAINGNLRARSAAVFLEGALGTKTIGGGMDTFNVADDLPFLTIEKKIGSASPELLVLRSQDAMVNTLNITAPAGALATFSAGLVTAGESRQTSALVTPSYPAGSDDLLVFHGGRIKTGTTGGTLLRDDTFQSCEIVINNNVATDEFTVRPSRFLRSLTEGIRNVEANMTLVFENPDKYSQYTYGATSSNSPGYSFFLGGLNVFLGNFQIANSDDIITATPVGVTVQAVEIDIPKLAFTGLPVALASGRIAVTTTARALKGTGDILTSRIRPNGAGLL